MDVAITLVCLALAVYTFRPRRRHMAPRATVRAAAPSRPRRPSPPLVPLLAALVVQAIGHARLTMREAGRVAKLEWQRVNNPPPPRRPLLSSRPDVAMVSTPEILPFPARSEARNDRTTEQENEEQSPQDKEPDIKMTKDRVVSVLFMTSKGLTPETIAKIAIKDPDAIVAALRSQVKNYHIAKVMVGGYQKNLHEVEAIANERA